MYETLVAERSSLCISLDFDTIRRINNLQQKFGIRKILRLEINQNLTKSNKEFFSIETRKPYSPKNIILKTIVLRRISLIQDNQDLDIKTLAAAMPILKITFQEDEILR